MRICEGIYTLPKYLDEKVAHVQLRRLNAELSVLTEEQATYIGIKRSGLYKPEYYRY